MNQVKEFKQAPLHTLCSSSLLPLLWNIVHFNHHVHLCLLMDCFSSHLLDFAMWKVWTREFYKSMNWFYQVYTFFSRMLKLYTVLYVGGYTRNAARGRSIAELLAPWRLLVSSCLSLSYQKICLIAALSMRSSAWNFTEAYVKSSMNRICHDD